MLSHNIRNYNLVNEPIKVNNKENDSPPIFVKVPVSKPEKLSLKVAARVEDEVEAYEPDEVVGNLWVVHKGVSMGRRMNGWMDGDR